MFTVNKKALLNSLAVVKASVASGKSALPVLSHVLIEADHGAVTLTTTDLESKVINTIPCQTDKPVNVCLPYKELDKIIRSVRDDDITIKADGENGRIIAGKLSVSLRGIDAVEFPPFEPLEGEPVEIDLSLAEPLLIHASTDPARPVLQGVRFTADKIVTTDGWKIMYQNVNLKLGERSVNVPASIVKKAVKIFNTPVRMYESKSYIGLVSGNTSMFIQKIEGNYPDWKQFIPKDIKTAFTIDRQAWIDAINQVEFVAKQGTGAVVVGLTDGKAIITAKAEGEGMEASIDTSANRIYGHCPVRFAVNAFFVIDVLKSFSDDVLQVTYTRDHEPIRFIGDGLTCILMPMRLG